MAWWYTRHLILAICEDVQGVYRSIPASLSTEYPDWQSAGTTADESREPFHGGCGNRFCRSEPLHADVQEGHWSYTKRLASGSHPQTLLESIARLMRRSRLERSRVAADAFACRWPTVEVI